MTINTNNFRKIEGRSYGSAIRRSFFSIQKGAAGPQCYIKLDKDMTEEVIAMLGRSVGVLYSPISCAVVLTRSAYDNSRVVSRSSHNTSASIAATSIIPALRKLYGEHRRYYVDARWDLTEDGSDCLVLTPNGEFE